MSKRKLRLIQGLRSVKSRKKNGNNRQEVMPPPCSVPNYTLAQLRYELEERSAELKRQPYAAGEKVKVWRSDGTAVSAFVEEVEVVGETLDEYRYTIVIPEKLNAQKGKRHKGIKAHRLHRPEAFFAQQRKWMDAAVRETGFEREEISFRLQAMNRQLKTPPRKLAAPRPKGPKNPKAYKNFPNNGDAQVVFPLTPRPFQAMRKAPKKKKTPVAVVVGE